MDTALETVAKNIVSPQKGILAADWSQGSIKKRFDELKLESTQETRRAYRELLFTAPGLENYISAVIMHSETLAQKTSDNISFPELLEKRGIIAGVRVDTGQVDMPGFKNEKISEGMDGLREKLKEYKKLGAKFAKWRAVYTISDTTPSIENVKVNTTQHALYALYCLEAGLVPIVEPDVLRDGMHDIDKCRQVSEEVLKKTFLALSEFSVDRKKIILKPNMITAGKESKTLATAVEVGEKTVDTLLKCVPVDVPGIAFLSGGQESSQAIDNLNEIVTLAQNAPWQLTFSFARALQGPLLEVWKGDNNNKEVAQNKLLEVAKNCSLARQAKL